MAGKKTATKRTTTAKTAEVPSVPRSPVVLAEAIRRRMKRSPNYWTQLQTAMQAVATGLPFRTAQAEPRTQH